MSESFEEIVKGERLLRRPPDARHETICERLHSHVGRSIALVGTTRLLGPRSVVQIAAGTLVRPDLALVTVATGKLWLAAEIVNTQDHRIDTVTKKQIYEELNLPRLWMLDPRYDNVEVYHASEYGLMLKGILAGREILRENLLPQLEVSVTELFGR
ncbi:MAG: Uma2 family endonuclease [Verrucomicrobia bacterium]|nr:Uma2 family endonuclease [Verrucomicrobiota bacterium]